MVERIGATNCKEDCKPFERIKDACTTTLLLVCLVQVRMVGSESRPLDHVLIRGSTVVDSSSMFWGASLQWSSSTGVKELGEKSQDKQRDCVDIRFFAITEGEVVPSTPSGSSFWHQLI